MKIISLILISLLLLLSACSRKRSGSSDDVKTDAAISDSKNDIDENAQHSQVDDTAIVKGLLPELEQYISSDNMLNFTLPSRDFKLFGMSVLTDTFLPGDTVGENKDYFSHYNPEVLRIIDKALDIPLVQQLLARIQSIHLSQGLNSEQFSTSRFEQEADFFNSLILHRLYLKKYPELFKKIQHRYEMAICKDSSSEYLCTTFDLPGSFYGPYAAFWIRRSFDGTDTLFESILKKTIRIMNPAVCAAVDSIAATWGNIRADDQVVLSFDSYSDEYGMGPEASIFPARENMLNNNAYFLDTISNFGRNDSIEFTIKKSAAEKMLREKSGYTLFDGSYIFYALYTKNNDPQWLQIVPEYSLTFKSSREPCGGEGLYWGLHLTVGLSNDTAKPMLITAISPLSKKRPGKRIFIPQGSTESTIPESETESYTVTTSYALPKGNHPLIKLWKIDTLVYLGDEISKRVVLKSTLMGKWPDGSERPIYSDEGEGVYTYTDASISDIVLTDINGDGVTDISFVVKANGKWIALFREGTVFEVKNIKRAKPDVSGGC